MKNISITRYKDLSTEVKASLAYAICNILVNCFSLITLPIFTRLMTKEEYGLSTVYASTAAIVVIFTSLQLPYGTFSTAMIKFKDDRDGYLSSLCAITASLTLIYLVICILLRDYFEKWLDLPLFLILIMGIEMLSTTSSVAWMGKQRFEFKYKSVVIVTITIAIISVLVSLIFVVNSNTKGIAKVLSNAAVVSIIGLSLFFYLLFKGKKPFEKKYWKFALSFNVPLIPYYLSQVVFNQSDRLMINTICGKSDAAQYGVAYSLATILTFIVLSIHNSYTPWIFERICKKEFSDNRRVTLLLSVGISFMLLGVIALAPELVLIMAGEQYKEAVWVVPPVAMSVLLLYYADLFDCLLFYYEAKMFLTIAALVSATVNIILNYIFIHTYGFIAAAYTTLASYMVLAIIDYICMLKICKKNSIDKKIYSIKGLFSIFGIFSAIGFTAMALYNYPIVRYTIIGCVLILLVILRKKVFLLYNIVKNSEI